MKLYQIFFCCIMLLCYACSDKETLEANITDCTNIANAKILTEAERRNECHYLEVYRYQGELYTLCECCVCDKAAIITKCDGQPLCGTENSCWEDFFENREYLFCVTVD